MAECKVLTTTENEHYGILHAIPTLMFAHCARLAGRRVRNMRSALQRGPLKDNIEWRTPRPATVEELTTVHDPEYVAMLEKASEAGKKFGVSTTLHKGLWRPITLAAGAAVCAVDAVLKGAPPPRAARRAPHTALAERAAPRLRRAEAAALRADTPAFPHFGRSVFFGSP